MHNYFESNHKNGIQNAFSIMFMSVVNRFGRLLYNEPNNIKDISKSKLTINDSIVVTCTDLISRYIFLNMKAMKTFVHMLMKCLQFANFCLQLCIYLILVYLLGHLDMENIP